MHLARSRPSGIREDAAPPNQDTDFYSIKTPLCCGADSQSAACPTSGRRSYLTGVSSGCCLQGCATRR